MRLYIDHILTLQQSLAHHERMLSESHPTYRQNLRMHLLRTRNKLDYDMFILAIVAVMILPQEMIIGMYILHCPRINQVIE